MGLDRDVARLLAELAASDVPSLSDGSVAEARANYDSNPKPPPDPIAHVVDEVVGGPEHEVPVRVYADAEPDGLPVVVFFHGGGWVLSSVAGHDSLARRIARDTGALVVSVDYRLAPEHPFPAPHDDCWSATAWLADHATEWGGDPDRLVVCGDSAGGNLAAGVALRARDAGLALALQALIYPCIDDRHERYESMTTNATGYFLTRDDMAWFWDRFVPGDRRDDPLAVPARAADLHEVAPAFVQTAEFDPLRDEGEVYAGRLRDAGVPAEVVRYPGVVHGFVSRWHVMARAEQAHADLATAIRRAVHP